MAKKLSCIALILSVFGGLNACDSGVSTVRYEAGPAAETATGIVKHGLVDLDFERAAKYMVPELEVNDESTARLVFSALSMYGFPVEVELSHFAFDYENNGVIILGAARGVHVDRTVIVSTERRSDMDYRVRDVRVSLAPLDGMKGLRKLPAVQLVSRPTTVVSNLELKRYLDREKVLFPPKEGEYVAYSGESYVPASAIYQRLYQGEWLIEVEYVSEFGPANRSQVIAEAEQYFHESLHRLAEIANVNKSILAARQSGSSEVYRVLFARSESGSWVRANL